MQNNFARLLLSGTNSGCGKTTVFCAILKALKLRGEDVAAFKCGPDFIDPMFHAAVIGAPSANADSYFCGEWLSYVFAQSAHSVNLIEGAMGYYDGMGFTREHSAWDVGRRLHAPAVLIVDGKGAALSVVAQMQGFARFCRDSGIRGFIINRVTERTYSGIRSVWKDQSIRLYGYLPPLPEEYILKSRHLGLVTAGEVQDLQKKMQDLAVLAEKTLDIDGLLQLARQAPALEYREPALPALAPLKMAVARDAAFCFYYKENFDLFRTLGAQIEFFSPLSDESVPQDADVLWFGGGYPELYAEQLEANESMRASVRTAAEKGTPVFAECGGFLYLNKLLDGRKMAGVLDGSSENKKRPVRFGYIGLEAKEDCLLANKGMKYRAHEFHYYDCTDNGNGFIASRKGSTYECMVADQHLVAGFPHIHFYSNLEGAVTFYKNCLENKK